MPLTKKRVILAALERFYATDATPSASTNAIEVSDLEISPLNAERKESPVVKQWLGGNRAALSNQHIQLSFSVTAAGSGTKNVAPAWALLLKGCGFTQTNDTNSVSYRPISDNFSSLTFYVYQDGTLHKVTGARGNFNASLNANDYASLSFTFRGLYQTPEASSLPNANYSAFKTPLTLSRSDVDASSIVLFGRNVAAASLSLDMGVSAPFISYMNAESVEITDRHATGSIEIRDPSVSEFNFFAKVEKSATGSFVLTLGKKSGSIVGWSAPKVQLSQPSYGDREGIRTLKFDMHLLPHNGNDELTITTK